MAFSSSSTSNNVALAQGNQQVPPIEMPPTIELTPKEDALCALLDDTCAWIARERPELVGDGSGKCECRIAGGWVRDKVSRPIVPVRSLSQQPTEPPPPPRGTSRRQLLSRGSDDLDISTSTMTGLNFALALKEYLSASGRGDEMGGHIGKIDANPEQSKNLETATARLMDLSIDFVNLRKEVYEGTSRIPVMVRRPFPPASPLSTHSVLIIRLPSFPSRLLARIADIRNTGGRRRASGYHDQFLVFQRAHETSRRLHRSGGRDSLLQFPSLSPSSLY